MNALHHTAITQEECTNALTHTDFDTAHSITVAYITNYTHTHCSIWHVQFTFWGEATSVELEVVDEASEGAGLGAESGDCGGVARKLATVGSCMYEVC